MAADKPCPQLQPSLVCTRYRHRFFDHVGHEKTYFFTILLYKYYLCTGFTEVLNDFVRSDDVTVKSLIEALILASTNLQYDKRLFFDLPFPYMKMLCYSIVEDSNADLTVGNWNSKIDP